MKGTELVKPTTNERELSTVAAAENARAIIAASFHMALTHPRDTNQARVEMLESCTRPRFAESALYSKPVGGRKITGLSIRAAEELIRLWGNIRVSTNVIYDDLDKRVLNICVMDLQTNSAYSQEVTLQKTVERKKLKDGQVAISERVNSYGEVVYLVHATEDDFLNKQGSAISKVIRNYGLRLIPPDIKEEVIEQIQKTLTGNIEANRADEIKKITDAFYTLGVMPEALGKYLDQDLGSLSPQQIIDLRGTYTRIKEGDITWKELCEQKAEQTNNKSKSKPAPAKGKFKPAKKQPEKGELKPGGETLPKANNPALKGILEMEKKLKAKNPNFDFITLMGKFGATCHGELNEKGIDGYGNALAGELGQD